MGKKIKFYQEEINPIHNHWVTGYPVSHATIWYVCDSNVGSIVSVYFGLIRETFLFNFKLNFYHSSCLDLFSQVPHENWCLSFQYRRLKLTISYPTHSTGHSCVLHGISSSGFSSPPFPQTLSATADLSSFLMHFTLRVFFPVKESDRHDWLETTL